MKSFIKSFISLATILFVISASALAQSDRPQLLPNDEDGEAIKVIDYPALPMPEKKVEPAGYGTAILVGSAVVAALSVGCIFNHGCREAGGNAITRIYLHMTGKRLVSDLTLPQRANYIARIREIMVAEGTNTMNSATGVYGATVTAAREHNIYIPQ